MGKIVGGTGMLNNMIYVRGHPEDFNEWFKDKENYNYVSDVMTYFKKVEAYQYGNFCVYTSCIFFYD